MYATHHVRARRSLQRICTALVALACAFGSALIARPALADSATLNFESYTPGTINGQDGWNSTGAAGSGCAAYDHAVVANTYGYSAFGTQSLRISNAITSGCFSDQTFSKSLVDEAGETSATGDGLSGGARQSAFTAQWDFASTVPNSEQAGLSVVASPDRGDGARMSWVQMADTPTGLAVNFYDFQHSVGDFIQTNVASNLDRTIAHTLKINMFFVDGPANDVVQIFVDGVLKHTGTSWEDYFRDSEGNPTHTVDSILFRTGGAAAPATAGNGFLIDNLQLSSGTLPQCSTTCYVNAVTGSDAFGGDSPASAKQTIQAGINQVTAGGTVLVATGIYTEAITINKSDLTITGAGASVTTIKGPKTGGSDTVSFSSTGGTLQGFTITRDGNNPTDWNANTRNQGVTFSGSGNTLRSAIVTGNRNGILLASSGNTIVDNTIDSNRTGIHIISSAKNNSIQGNQITNNFTIGIVFRQDDSAADATIVRGNQISGNWYSQIDDRGNPAGTVRDLRANWFGAPPLTTVIGNTSGEPGYAAQIPVAFGGTATPPPSAPTFVVNNQDPNSNGDSGGRGNLNTNRLAYSPWLSTGTNAAAGVPGFVGDFSSLTADDVGATVGATGFIQAGLNFVTTGGSVLVETGTFTENLTITRTVTLSGAGQANSLLRPAISNPNCGGAGGGSLCAGGSNIILVQANDVTIHDLTLDGDNPALTSGIVRDGADLDARNGIITNHAAGVFNALDVHNVTLQNIYLRGMYASSGGTFNFHANTVQNIQGDAASIGIFNFGGAGSMISNTVTFANDAISANHSRGTQFLNNTVTHSASGVHSDNAGDGGGSADMIANNDVRDCMTDGYGVWVFVPYIAPTVQQNTVQNCDIGLAAFGQGAAVTTNFSANEVDAANRPGSIGVFATTDMVGFGSSNNSSTFTNNRVVNATYGFMLEAQPTYTLTISATENAISGNTTAGMFLQNTGTFATSAIHNWWGSPTGPANAANPGGIGDSVAANISFDPWLCAGTDTSPAIGFQPNVATLCGGSEPDTTITSHPANPSTSPSATFAFTGTDDVTPLASLTFECKLDGASFTACTSPATYTGLADGAHTFQVRATDLASHTDATPASYSWSIQPVTSGSDAPPDTTITSQPLSQSTSPTATFSFTGTDDLTPLAGLTFECSLDGVGFTACTSAKTYTGLANGTHTFQVRATDLTSHTDATPASYSWTVNATTTPAQRKLYLALIQT